MTKNEYESQFSVYKLDYERAMLYFKNEVGIELSTIDEIEEQIYKDIKQLLEYKTDSESNDINKNGFKGIVFKTVHYPNWKGMIESLIDSESVIKINNSHISYLLTYINKDSMYLLTNGLGSNYITNIIQKNYGLYLLPKLVLENDSTVKTVLENKITGNRLSDRRANRNKTTINFENELATIFRELSLEFDKDVMSKLGIEVDKKTKGLNVIAKDSFVIRKSMTLDKLKTVLNNLILIEQNDDNFSLGYLVPAKKYDYKSSEINELLVDSFLQKKYDNFIIVGDEYSEYLLGCTKYVITDDNENIILEKDEPIKMEEVFSTYFPDKITKNRIDSFFKLKLSTYEDKSIKLFFKQLKECLQGYVENTDRVIFYLFNGEWVIFDPKYTKYLDDEYKKQYNEMIQVTEKTKELIQTNDAKLTEGPYNLIFKTSDKIILSHKVVSNNVELADLIYFDDGNVYLFHNKEKFNGAGVRDVMNQILTSAEFISTYSYDSIKRNENFATYYNSIKKKYPENKKIQSLSEQEFFDLITKSSNIYYVAGFLEGLSINTASNYAKYIILDVNKRLKQKGFNLLLLNIRK